MDRAQAFAPWALAALVIGGLVWLFVIREPVIAMESPHARYALPIPTTYLMRLTERAPIEVDGRELDIVITGASVPFAESDAYFMAYFELPADVARGGLREQLVEEALRGGIGGMGLDPSAPIEHGHYGGRGGREVTFRGLAGRSLVKGRMRAFDLGEELVIVFFTCAAVACEDDPDRIADLDALSIETL